MKEGPHFLFSKVVFSTQYADFKEHLITRVAHQGGQVRVFRALAQPQNGKYCSGIATEPVGPGGPDWARTSDPALIKRML
jgi:hypothetical protein